MDAELRGKGAVLSRNRVERVFRIIHHVHLVYRQHHMRHANQAGQVGVAARLRQHALLCVDQNDHQVGRARGGHHVASVLLMPRRVADDELAPGRGEIAVGHVDGDALLALGLQAVGQQRQVDSGHAALLAGPGDRRELVLEDRFRVMQQTPDQRALAVVHAAGGDEAEELDCVGHNLALYMLIRSSFGFGGFTAYAQDQRSWMTW